MTNKELADLMYPDVTKTIDYYEELYPKRDLPEGAVVSRFAPSPTGFVHMGSLMSSFIERFVPKTTGGVFYLRIEDTDQKREVENGIQGIIDDLDNFGITRDEGVISETEEKGNYGPYIQTKRIEIYHTFAKWMVEQGYAYPCFCSAEELEVMRKKQEAKKLQPGYYGGWAKCRDLSNEERAERIKNGESWTLRIKSRGLETRKCVVNDLVRGKIEFPENYIDHVLIKDNGIPVYHFAHLVDDHLMRTTHVLRGEEWLPSTPLHTELFQMFGFEQPKYGHLGLLMKIDEEGTRRKLSKRKDPEAAVSFYHEKGIPLEAVHKYLLTIANSNFEGWLDQNPDASIYDFTFDFRKMSASGSLFDVDKMLNIAKNHISRMKAIDVYNAIMDYYKEFDPEFADIISKDKDYTVGILNIEREQKKPRKDYACWSDVKGSIWYMYDELYEPSTYEWMKITDMDEIKNILNKYLEEFYDPEDDKDTWFNKIQQLSDSLGYAGNMKDYKENPDNYKGNVSDISTVIRVALTSKCQTPDLYEIMRLLGKDRIEKRINNLK